MQNPVLLWHPAQFCNFLGKLVLPDHLKMLQKVHVFDGIRRVFDFKESGIVDAGDRHILGLNLLLVVGDLCLVVPLNLCFIYQSLGLGESKVLDLRERDDLIVGPGLCTCRLGVEFEVFERIRFMLADLWLKLPLEAFSLVPQATTLFESIVATSEALVKHLDGDMASFSFVKTLH